MGNTMLASPMAMTELVPRSAEDALYVACPACSISLQWLFPCGVGACTRLGTRDLTTALLKACVSEHLASPRWLWDTPSQSDALIAGREESKATDLIGIDRFQGLCLPETACWGLFSCNISLRFSCLAKRTPIL